MLQGSSTHIRALCPVPFPAKIYIKNSQKTLTDLSTEPLVGAAWCCGGGGASPRMFVTWQSWQWQWQWGWKWRKDIGLSKLQRYLLRDIFFFLKSHCQSLCFWQTPSGNECYFWECLIFHVISYFDTNLSRSIRWAMSLTCFSTSVNPYLFSMICGQKLKLS